MSSVYVAAKFEQKDLVKTMIAELEAAGYTVTYDWTDDDATGLEGQALEDYLAAHAVLDRDGVLNADHLILVPHNKGKGSWTELGLAIGAGKMVHVWNKNLLEAPNIFLNLPEIYQIAGSKDWLWEFEKCILPKMDIVGAIGAMLQGAAIRRKAWPDSHGHAMPGAEVYNSTAEDLMATDWFIVPAWRLV